MKVLELFAGTRSVSKAFEARGHEVFSIEWDRSFPDIDLYADVGEITAEDIIEAFGRPDVIWASPDCTTYSVAAISKHRAKGKETGNLYPISEYASFCDRVNAHVISLIQELNPRYWFIENPRGGVKENGLYERSAPIHRNILSVRRHQNETDRHMDKPPRPAVQTPMSLWRSLPCASPKRVKNWHTGVEGGKRKSCHSPGLV